MERSLRSTGCTLPMFVIPYNDSRFELPRDSEWWIDEALCSALNREASHPCMRKYQCLSATKYQFIDTDVCFLRNPEDVLRTLGGFVTSCGHWHNPDHTLTDLSKRMLSERSTTWQSKVFNSGQFACDRQLYSAEDLEATIFNPSWSSVTARWPHNEQPGLNLLVSLSGVPVTNLTLPPTNMQSTWAGDYPGEFRHYWVDEPSTPYLIHWAGMKCSGARPIDSLFRAFLSSSEQKAFDSRPPRFPWRLKGRASRAAGGQA